MLVWLQRRDSADTCPNKDEVVCIHVYMCVLQVLHTPPQEGLEHGPAWHTAAAASKFIPTAELKLNVGPAHKRRVAQIHHHHSCSVPDTHARPLLCCDHGWWLHTTSACTYYTACHMPQRRRQQQHATTRPGHTHTHVTTCNIPP